MFDRAFNIDFDRLVSLVIPPMFRQITGLLWLRSLISPLKIVYSQFNACRSANLYNLDHNSQVCRMRKMLNDAFDPELRRVSIGEGNQFDRQYIYTHVEEQPKYLGVMYLRQRSDYADTGVDFRVIIPDGFDLPAVVFQMRAAIDFYKLASKRYKIQYDE